MRHVFRIALLLSGLASLSTADASAVGATLEEQLAAEPAETLATEAKKHGDAVRGAVLFYHSSLTCVACHSNSSESPSVGPDLTKIKREVTNAAIVDSVLRPSQTIAAGYETITVQTTDGVLVQGLLVEETADELILRDAVQHEKLTTIKVAEIDERQKSDKSIMPVGQVNLLADRQQFLDLLRFLFEVRKGGITRMRELQLEAHPIDSDFPLAPTAERPSVQRGEIGINKESRYPRGIAIGYVDGTALFDADRLRIVAQWDDGFVKTLDQNYFGFNWGCGSDTPIVRASAPYMIKFADEPWRTAESPIDSDPHEGSSFAGYQIGEGWVRLRYHARIGRARIGVTEDVRIEKRKGGGVLSRVFRFTDLPAAATVALMTPRAEDYRHHGRDGQELQTPHDVDQAPAVSYRLDDRLELLSVHADGAAKWDLLADADGSAWGCLIAASADGTASGRIDMWRAREGDLLLRGAELAEFAAQAPQPTGAFDKKGTGVAAPSGELPEWVASSQATRPAVVSTRNVDDFPPATGRFLRFEISRTIDGAGPGIDELEIYGSDLTENLAQRGKATASSVIPGYDIHEIKNLNDGRYGNEHSWVGHERGRGWVQVEFDEPIEMRRVVWGRDRSGHERDRLAVNYSIKVSDDGQQWHSVGNAQDRAPPLTEKTRPLRDVRGYEIESIPLPFAGCRPSDIAFGEDDSLYVIAMTEGQIWRGKRPPINEPTHIKWDRYAVGLNHPLGIVALGGRLFVAQKPEITELIDRNHDGVVDEYRTIATGWGLSPGWHEYCFGLCADRQNNLWFALNTGFFWTNPGYVNPGRWRGSVMRVATDTERCEVVARGCRVPNGIAIGPDNQVFFTDNQGDWIQSCKLAHVVPGRFYGHPEYREDALPKGEYPDGRSAIWFPYEKLRSVSGPVYDTTRGKFGPFAGQMFVGDVGYGANSGIMRVALEKVDGEYQGACFPFTEAEPLGCERLKFGPDDCLYAASLTSGLQRMRFVGSEALLAIESVQVRPAGEGFVIKFTQPIGESVSLKPAKIEVTRYHYVYSGKYGSPRSDETTVPVRDARWSDDRTSLTLTLPVESHPLGMVYEARLPSLRSDAGEKLTTRQFWYTVNRLPQ